MDMFDFQSGAWVDVIGGDYRKAIERRLTELAPEVEKEREALEVANAEREKNQRESDERYKAELELYADACKYYEREVARVLSLPFWRKKVFPIAPERPANPRNKWAICMTVVGYASNTAIVEYNRLQNLLRGISDTLIYHIPMNEAVAIGLGKRKEYNG